MNLNHPETIQAALTQALEPTFLELVDESHLHKGHPGAQSGGKHFYLRISAPSFKERSMIDCHRLIYQAVTPFMGTLIHALRIEVVSQADESLIS